jgi:hypothetical protein
LGSADVASAIEMLAAISPVPKAQSLAQHSTMERLRRARTCYDHLAGRLGVDVTDALARKRLIRPRGDAFDVTSAGESFFISLGVDLDAVRHRQRSFSRACLDWTERRHHLGGALGAALLDSFLRRRWVVRNARDRSLQVAPGGAGDIGSTFGFDVSL